MAVLYRAGSPGAQAIESQRPPSAEIDESLSGSHLDPIAAAGLELRIRKGLECGLVLLKHRKLLVASFVPLLLVFWGLACNGNEAANLPLTETATSTRESPTLTAEEAAEQQAFEGAAAT